jgi:hypothetical protein
MIRAFRKSFGEWGYPNNRNSQMNRVVAPREMTSLPEDGKTGYD